MPGNVEKGFLVSKSFIEQVEQLVRWRKNLRVTGAYFRNTPEGASLNIPAPKAPPPQSTPKTDIPVLVTQNGGSAGTNKSASCTYTYDIYDAINDPSKANKLNSTGGALSLTGKGNGWRGLKLQLTTATRGRAYRDSTGAWVLTDVDEYPAGEQDCS